MTGAVKWRAAVIGCGWIGTGVADDPKADGIQAHAAAYAACADTALAGVCDVDAARAAHAARRFGLAHGFCDVAALLAEVVKPSPRGSTVVVLSGGNVDAGLLAR